MINKRITTITLLFWLSGVKCSKLYPQQIIGPARTALAIKQGIDDFNDSIPIEINGFKELVQKSKFFIDTSSMIQDVMDDLNRNFIMQLIGPRQWRKSTNLDMLKTFLEVQVDENGTRLVPLESTPNYRLFAKGEIVYDDGHVEKLQKPLLIANDHRWMNFHIGRYPIVFVSFADTVGENFDVVYQKMVEAVSRAFKQHEYMIKILEHNSKHNTSQFYRLLSDCELQRFKKHLYLDGTPIEPIDLADSLKFLCHLLHDHFGEKVYILVDDYDKPIHNYLKFDKFSNEDKEKMIEYIDQFMGLTCKLNVHREMVVATGVYKTCFDNWNTYDLVHSVDEFKPFQEFFGFNQDNMNAIFELYKIDQKQAQQVRAWYDGYESKFLKYNFYHPVSTLNFLKHRKLQNYRQPLDIEFFVRRAFTIIPQFRSDMLTLLSQQTIRTRGSRKYFTYFWEEANEKIGYYGQNLLHLYLLGESYLTETQYEGFEKTRPIKLSNIEAAYVISNWMVDYYKQTYHIDQTLLENVSNSFRHFISVETSSNDMQDSFSTLYKNSTLHVHLNGNTPQYENEDAAHALLHCVALQMQRFHQFDTKVYYNKTLHADLVVIEDEKSQATLIELRYNQSTAQKACEEAEKHISLKLFNKFSKIKLIGIHLPPNKSVNIVAKTIKK